MIEDILERTGADRAVMIGDRDNDREAALTHRVPFILFRGGFHATEPVDGDRVAYDYGEVRDFLLPASRT